MEGMLPSNTVLSQKAALQGKAVDLGKFLDSHNGGDVVVMDMGNLNYWTDFFVIATVTSNAHLSGMERHIKEFAAEGGMEILHRSRRPASGAEPLSEEWCLLDLGGIVVHLMTGKARSFFELERLWGSAPLVYRSGTP